MHDLKAQVIDDNHLRVLAIPFGGPVGGKDLDGEFFSRRTDIKPDWFAERPALWHHGQDPLIQDRVVGKAVDLTQEEDGWWVDLWLERADRYAELVQALGKKTPLYGSSGTLNYLKRVAPDGEILVWPYVEQTLTLTPSNVFSITRTAKAVMDAYDDADIRLDTRLKAVLADVDGLRSNLLPTSPGGEDAARDERLEAFNRKAADVLAVLRQR